MKYKFKNKELEKAVLALFDKESAMKNIAEQMPDGSKYIVFENESLATSATPLIAETWGISDLQAYISFPKTEIEETKEYSPTDWNPFPEITPPKPGIYLVQFPNSKVHEDGNKYLMQLAVNIPDYWEALKVVAFRELPAPYENV